MQSMYQAMESQAGRLLEILKERGMMGDIEAESVVHALVDIAESFEKVYSEIVPGILKEPNAGFDDLKDRLWDIREEFRHIAYHISDGKLTEL